MSARSLKRTITKIVGRSVQCLNFEVAVNKAASLWIWFSSGQRHWIYKL